MTAKSQSTSRIVIGLICAVAAIALVAGTWFVAQYFQSPAQREASAEPPPPGPVVVAVKRGDLLENTTTMARAVKEEAAAIAIPLGAETEIVTGLGTRIGDSLAPGAVVTWVNGRPIFAIVGAFPLYRNLVLGDSGPDMEMLQEALNGLGCDIAVDGSFGGATAACVTSLYRNVASEPSMRTVETAPEASASVAGAADLVQPIPPKQEIQIRSADFLVFPSLPKQVVSVPPIGTKLSPENAKVDVAGLGISLEAEVPGSVASGLSVGMTAEATGEGEVFPVRILAINPVTGEDSLEADSTQASQAPSVVVVFEPVGGQLPEAWAGQQVLVTLNLSEPITDTLLVPQRAVAAGSDGRTSVLVQTSGGGFEQVAVEELGCTQGMCAIEGAGLEEGSLVRVDR